MKEKFLKSFDLEYSKEGILHFSGVNLSSVVEEFLTPVYVFSEDKIVKNINEFRYALEANFPNYQILYASKSFSVKEIYRILKREGIGADVVSPGEIYTALDVGFEPRMMYFHGNAKSNEDLALAITRGINIVVDNESELNSIFRIAEKLDLKAKILLRLKPGITPPTHTYIATGHLESKFGLNLEEAKYLVEIALQNRRVNLLGFHYHIGSQILSLEAFERSAQEISQFIKNIEITLGYYPLELNVGGGFGIAYTESDRQIPKVDFINAIKRGLTSNIVDFSNAKILIEPGRAIVGDAGIIIYRVIRKKKVLGKEYLFVDGGMGDNIRIPLYGARYTVINLKLKGNATKKYSIFGKYCESGDVIAVDVELEEVEEGDYLALLSGGAYTYSMASNYNRFTRPPVVFLRNNTINLVVKRETYHQVMQNDI